MHFERVSVPDVILRPYMEDLLQRVEDRLDGKEIAKSEKSLNPSVKFVLFRDGFISKLSLRNCRLKTEPMDHPLAIAVSGACPFPNLPESRAKQLEVCILITDEGPRLQSEDTDDVLTDNDQLKPYLERLLGRVKACLPPDLLLNPHAHFKFYFELNSDGSIRGAIQLGHFAGVDVRKKLAALSEIKAASPFERLPEWSEPLTVSVTVTETLTQLIGVSKTPR